MKRYVTRLQTLSFTNFSVAFLFWMLSLNGANAAASVSGANVNELKAVNSTLVKKVILLDPKERIISGVTPIEITLNPAGATNIKLTGVTIEATIDDPEGIISERGVCWRTTPGVSITDHKTVEGLTANGTFTVNLTGLDRSKTIYYRGYYIDEDGTTLSDELSFSNVPVFSGTGNWNETARWNVQEIPLNVQGDSVIIDGFCTADNLTIDAGAIVTVNAGKALIVTNAITNNAGTSGLIIKSDAINNGTLTFKTGTPEATVEMYSKAKWDLYQADGSKYSWQFFGVPVKTFTLTDAFSNCFVRKYDETATIEAGLWINQSPQTPLITGNGYEIVQEGPFTYKFTGELTNDNFSTSLNYISGTSYPGQHIFGNPYTAAISISSIVYDVNTENAVYLYNTGTYNQWVDNGNNPNPGILSAPGQYTVSTPATIGTLGVPSQIPSMQGFLVKTLSDTPGAITIPYSTGVVINAEPQRTPGVNGVTANDKVATRVDLSGSHIADCVWIFSDPTCTAGYDKGWDGYKMLGAAQNPQIYAMETNGDFQIDAVADINETFLGFNAGTETNYKLTFTHQNTEKLYQEIYLVDILENKTTDITTSGSEYAFTAVSTPTPEKRFKIVAAPAVKTGAPAFNAQLKIFNSNGTLFVQNHSDQTGSLTLYNMNGVAVKKTVYKANEITTISTTNLVPGAYIAKAFTNQEMVTERIIIR